jgi:glutaredoxin-like protein
MTSSNSSGASRADSNRGVRLVFFEQSIGCEICPPTRRALEQIAHEHEHVTFEALNLALDKQKAAAFGVDRVPALIIVGADGGRVRYFGAPLGNELPTVIEAIAMAAAGGTRLTEQSRLQLQSLSKPVRLQVFFTPSCIYCPQMISLANQAALESPLVSTTAIDATEFPDLVRRYHVNGVPKTVINESLDIVGAASEREFIDTLTNAESRAS